MSLSRIKSISKVTLIVIFSVLALILVIPEIFPGFIGNKIKNTANQQLVGKLEFKKLRLSFISHFPNLTLSLYDFSLMGSSPFEKDTLISGKELSFGVNIPSLFGKKIILDKIMLSESAINIQVDSAGQGNFNIVKSASTQSEENIDTSGSASIGIKLIEIKKSSLVYQDASLPMKIVADTLNYSGNGDLNSAIIELNSNLEAGGVHFEYDGEVYAENKHVKAELLTRINTGSFELSFAKNDLVINKLPIQFSGFVRLPESGYDIDLKFVSNKADLANVLSVLPPGYNEWVKDTKLKGLVDIGLSIEGKYRANPDESPDLKFSLQLSDGFVSHPLAPMPMENIALKLNVNVPSLDPDKLLLDLNPLSLTAGDGYLKGDLHIEGINEPFIKSTLDANIGLESLQQGLDILPLKMKGTLQATLSAEGKLRYGQNPSTRFADTILLELPAYQLKGSLANGYFKYDDLPLAINQASFNLASGCKNGSPENINVEIDDLDLQFGKTSKASGYIHYAFGGTKPIDAALKAQIEMKELQDCLPLDSMQISGPLFADITIKGMFDPAKKKLPFSHADITWKNGMLQTKYYPAPIEKINLEVSIENNLGNYKGLKVNLKPVHFVFEGQPFTLKADIQDLDNFKYNMSSKGTLDIGKISKVFSGYTYGIQADGQIITRLNMKGSQADALAGKWERLQNNGTIYLKNIAIKSEDFANPLIILSGKLVGEQDRLETDFLQLKYGRNLSQVKGFYRNLFPYIAGAGPLIGGLSIKADKLYLDDFMANADGKSPEVAKEAGTNASGVFMIPKDLSITFDADIKEAIYEKMKLYQVKGKISVDKGNLDVEDAKISLAGANLQMKANYSPVSQSKATFSFQVLADSFDIHRFYNEVPLFAELATSASKASGQVSLKYALSGKLNANMEPVLPSLTGGGTLSLENVQVKGLKLFSAVSKATGKDSINNPNLKKVDLNTSIANNLMTLEQTKMRIFGFRPRFEGQASLDGKLNLKLRLGLPPFGIIGIPMSITGTMENPIIKMRKAKKEDELEETIDESEQE